MTDKTLDLWRKHAQAEWLAEKTFMELCEAAVKNADAGTAIVNLMLLENARMEQERLKDERRIAQKALAAQVEHTRRLEDLIGHISLYLNNFAVKKMTTEQRELYADAHDAWSARLEPDDPSKMTRWWRDDYVGPRP